MNIPLTLEEAYEHYNIPKHLRVRLPTHQLWESEYNCLFPDVIPKEKRPLEPPEEPDEAYEDDPGDEPDE